MNRRAAGFTLMEVIVVVAVLGLILAMLGQGVRLALRGTGFFQAAIHTQSDMEPVERALRHIIERMDPGTYPDAPLVQGTAGSLLCTTELPNPATGGTMMADVRLEADRGALVMWWTPHTRGVPFEGAPVARRIILLDRVQRLDVSYTDRRAGRIWVSTWTQPALPALVRLRIVPDTGGAAWPPIIVRTLREAAEE